ncbi:hypothetical protein IQ266_14855 [filamentous cyanobacterium LEGE 11480]|uniref:Uncharacterized protein n=1 Tax=Romeriopsis navalis LEGE 11480 TaxID=2777977 RepID=A0A928VR44_9CYAN|nr:hypothetical protein [Romeriopsis navalis]MBE9031012.1 hypothetical protein [Romeriopsis navalis LEGE 11480]
MWINLEQREQIILINRQFNQLTIADFADYQIVWPTKTQYLKKRFFSAWMSVPERVYAPIGWLIFQGQTIANLQGLDIASFAPVDSSFEFARRLGPAIPINFEASSERSLPKRVSNQAAFTYEMPDESIPRTIFRAVTPRFVRVYDFWPTLELSEIVTQMLIEEQRFITENREQLKLEPFYQAQFNL